MTQRRVQLPSPWGLIGFDQGFNNFGPKFSAPNYPPNNIIDLGRGEYRIEIAVAGFKDEQIDIVDKGGELSITGTMGETDGSGYLHRGISQRPFHLRYSLADGVKVSGANLADGILTVDLKSEPKVEGTKIKIKTKSQING
jgi:molecular chaperone IbpA